MLGASLRQLGLLVLASLQPVRSPLGSTPNSTSAKTALLTRAHKLTQGLCAAQASSKGVDTMTELGEAFVAFLVEKSELLHEGV